METKAQPTIDLWIKSRRIRYTATQIDHRPDRLMAGNELDRQWNDTANHWRITITHNRHKMQVYYSQGSAITAKPSLADVLGSLALDSSSVDQDFPGWCRDLGYSDDSIKAERIYRKCRDIRSSLVLLFGSDGFASLLNCEAL